MQITKTIRINEDRGRAESGHLSNVKKENAVEEEQVELN